MKRLPVIFILLLTLAGVEAQERLIREDSLRMRRERIMSIPANPERIRAIREAEKLGIPDRRLSPNGRVVAIRRIKPNGKPEYLTTFNLNAAKTVSTDRVWKDGGAGLDLSGEGLVVGVWDAGVPRSTHQEFEDRARLMNEEALVLGHPTHVSGTIGAAGIDEDARGMARQVAIESYDWDNDLNEMAAAASEGLLISNHSYGYILGFDYNSEERRWEWWGDTDISEDEDYLFGYYHSEARSYDRIAFENPDYLIVKSAGNDRGQGPAPGSEHYVWENGDWVPSTEIRQIDGGDDGYGSMGPISSAKNIMAVGAIRDLPDGVTDPEGVEITGYSVFGPTDDGRIKPDILANGQALYSSYSESDTQYRNISGTSMSAPNVSGSMALLQEYYHRVHGSYLSAASMKGLILHTASDAGNPGPDYKHGWGVMNTLEAAKVIGDTSKQRIIDQVLQNLDSIKFSVYSDGSQDMKLSICWTDPAGDVPPLSLNPTNRILVNDLDIRVIRKIDGQIFRPFILDPLQPSMPAKAGDNVLDNVEQVLIPAPDKGFYEIIVSHKGDLQGDEQGFSLIISGLTDKYYASGVTYLTDNNGEFSLTSEDEYLPNMEAGWVIAPENRLPLTLSFNFLDTEANQDLVRIYDGASSEAPLLAEFSGLLADIDTLLTGSGDTMWLTFTSNQQVQGRGFEASYCTTPPEGDFTVEGVSFACTGNEEAYLAKGQAGTRYSWIPPEGWELTESEGHYARLLAGSGDGVLELLPFNSCGASEKTFRTLKSISTLPRIINYQGDTVLCEGDLGTIEVDSLSGSAYQWSLPANWQGSSESHTISFVPSKEEGEIMVSAYNSCGQGDTLTIPVLVRSAPGEAQIYSVSDKICQNSGASFYLFAEEGFDYQWSVEEPWSISGEAGGDSVRVIVGTSTGSVSVEATNECGARISARSFQLTPQPDNPLLMESGSIYDDLRVLQVQNASSYTLINWYLNGLIIDSPIATGPSYVAYVPGLYTVGVTNREGCSIVQDAEKGINTAAYGKLFSVYAGKDGALQIQNASRAPASINVYDLSGKLLLIQEVDPGYSEIPTSLQGVQLISITGSGNRQVFRIFLR